MFFNRSTAPVFNDKNKKPYYMVYQPGDQVVAYTFYDPHTGRDPLVLVRPFNKMLSDSQAKDYELAHKARQKKRPVDFKIPQPSFTTLDELMHGEPALDQKLSAMSLALVIEHLKTPHNVHGNLHDHYDGWFDPKPFEPRARHTAWNRRDMLFVPNMSLVQLPAYDATTRALTYFTYKNESESNTYPNPYTTRHGMRKHVIDFASSPWQVTPPEEVPEIAQHTENLRVVDRAFNGEVQSFYTFEAAGASILVNRDEVKTAKKFVVLKKGEDAGAYDSFNLLLEAHPELVTEEFNKRFTTFVSSKMVQASGSVIQDAESWRDSLGKPVRIGSPKFTMISDESDYGPPEKIPSGSDEARSPSLEGDSLNYDVVSDHQVYRVTVDLRDFSSKKEALTSLRKPLKP